MSSLTRVIFTQTTEVLLLTKTRLSHLGWAEDLSSGEHPISSKATEDHRSAVQKSRSVRATNHWSVLTILGVGERTWSSMIKKSCQKCWEDCHHPFCWMSHWLDNFPEDVRAGVSVLISSRKFKPTSHYKM